MEKKFVITMSEKEEIEKRKRVARWKKRLLSESLQGIANIVCVYLK